MATNKKDIVRSIFFFLYAANCLLLFIYFFITGIIDYDFPMHSFWDNESLGGMSFHATFTLIALSLIVLFIPPNIKDILKRLPLLIAPAVGCLRFWDNPTFYKMYDMMAVQIAFAAVYAIYTVVGIVCGIKYLKKQ